MTGRPTIFGISAKALPDVAEGLPSCPGLQQTHTSSLMSQVQEQMDCHAQWLHAPGSTRWMSKNAEWLPQHVHVTTITHILPA